MDSANKRREKIGRQTDGRWLNCPFSQSWATAWAINKSSHCRT